MTEPVSTTGTAPPPYLPPSWLTLPENLFLPTPVSLTISQMQSALLELWELGIDLQESGAAIGSDILRIIQEKGQEHEGS